MVLYRKPSRTLAALIVVAAMILPITVLATPHAYAVSTDQDLVVTEHEGPEVSFPVTDEDPVDGEQPEDTAAELHDRPEVPDAVEHGATDTTFLPPRPALSSSPDSSIGVLSVVPGQVGVDVDPDAQTGPARLTVTPSRPVISAHPDDVVVTEGGAAVLSGAFVGTDAPTTAQWQFSTDGGRTWSYVPGGATDDSLALDPVTREMDGWQYRVRFTNAAGSAWSDAATVRVTFGIPAAAGEADPGGSVELRVYDPQDSRAGVMTITAPTGTTIESVRHNGVGGHAFVVSEDGTVATSTRSTWGHSSLSAWVTLRIADDVVPGSVLDDGAAQVVDDDVVLASGSLTVTVAGVIVITEHPASIAVPELGSATFRTGATGHEVVTRWETTTDWGVTWVELQGETGMTLVLDEVTLAMDGGRYRAVHTNAAGSFTTDVAILRVGFDTPVAAGSALPGESVEVRVSDPSVSRVGVMTVTAPTGTTIVAARHDGMTTPFVISDDGSTATSIRWTWGGSALSAWVTLQVASDAVPGAVLDDGTTEIVEGGLRVAQGLVSVTVAGTIEVTEHPASVLVPELGSATFRTGATGHEVGTRWETTTDGGVTWVDVQGETDTTLVLGEVSRAVDGHRFRAVHTNASGSVWSNAATLRVTFGIPAASGDAAPGESVELRIYDPESVRSGSMTITAPTGTTIESARHNSSVGPFEISEDGRAATSVRTAWGHSALSAWVTLRVDVDAVPGSVLDDGTVQIADAEVLVASGTLAVSVTGEIEVLEHPADVTVDVGTDAELTTAVSGHGVSTQWQVSTDAGATWVDVEGGTSTTLTLEATTPEMTRSWYRAVHTNAAGQLPTDHAVLLVRTAPYFTTHPTDTASSPGGHAFFRGWVVDGASSTTLTLTWELSRDGETWLTYEPGFFPEMMQSPNMLALSPVAAEMDGLRFRAVAENHLGSTVSDPALLTVFAAPVIDTHPADVRTLAGHDATFSASTPAVSPHRTQQWQESTDGGDWTDIPGATEPTYSTGPTALDMDQRQYRVVFTNHHGSTASEPATLTVRAPIPATLTVTPTVRLVDQLP